MWCVQLSGLKHGSGQATLVDFGNTVDCCIISDIFAAVHVELPSFAHHCHLHGADERSPTAVCNLLKQYNSAVVLTGRVLYKKSSSVHSMELVDTRNEREVKLLDLLLSATSAEVPPPADITAASVEYVYVTSVMADGVFFGQLSKYNSASLEQFRSQLNEYYRVNRVPAVAAPQRGDFCCCQYDVDSLYYRAKIMKKFAANGRCVVSVI